MHWLQAQQCEQNGQMNQSLILYFEVNKSSILFFKVNKNLIYFCFEHNSEFKWTFSSWEFYDNLYIGGCIWMSILEGFEIL